MKTKYTFILAICILLYIVIDLSQILVNQTTMLMRHVIATTILFVLMYVVSKKLRLNNLWLSVIGGLLFCFMAYSLERRLGFFDVFGYFIVTSFFAGMLSSFTTKKDGIFLVVGIVLYLFNIFISVFEYYLGVNLFYFDMGNKWNVVDSYWRFRATGIWGHPLYTALIHGACMIFIVMSNLRNNIKIILWFVGLPTLFLYDARASTLSVVIVTTIYIFLKGYLSKKYIVGIVLICILGYLSYSFISQSDIGGKLFDSQTYNFKDDSAHARIVAFQIFLDLNFQQLLLGVSDQYKYVQSHYNVVCAENAFIGMVLIYGLPLACIIFYLQIDNLLYAMSRIKRKYKILVVLYLFATGLLNQALVSYNIWILYLLFFILFCFNSRELQS